MHSLNSSLSASPDRPLAIFCISLGCPKNRVDTERMLASLGHLRHVEDLSQTEVVLVNTCGFIEPAVQESVQTILEAAVRIRDLGSRPLLVVAGCLVSRFGSDLPASLPEVDLWLKVHEEHLLPEMISKALHRELPLLTAPAGRVLSTLPAYAYLKISEGCNHRCRFCAIPAIRGRLASRPPRALVEEARAILDQGVSELVLVAQDLTSYGRDLNLRHGLEELLSGLAGLTGLRWLRLMYLYPAGLTPRLLGFLKQLGPRFLPYFDLPLQHVHPDILAAMGRPLARDPRHDVERIRRFFPDACLRTSLIVGFPGEKTVHFKALRSFVEQMRFNHLGVFVFSPEQGTPAAFLPGRVRPGTAEKRRRELMEMQSEISAAVLACAVGQDMDVLVDRSSPEWPGLFEGRVWFQAPEVDGMTYISGEQVRSGRMVRARIQESKTYDLTALALDEAE